MNRLIRPVILCGGSGTRLWPLSRRLEPKQFQKLVGDRSMFRETLARFEGDEFGQAMVLVNAVQEPRVQFELDQAEHPAGRPTVIVEPAMRSTAPAIAAAAQLAFNEDPDTVLIVVPSDHLIGRPESLLEAYRAALEFVDNGGIALFGICPTAPETGFGYIRSGEVASGSVNRVDAFIEKPDIEKATALLADGRHTWNSGIFMFRAATILEELQRYAPSVVQLASDSVETATREGNCVRLSEAFAEAPEISIDHAVMEHSGRLGVISVSPEWSDLGSFEALWQAGSRNAEDNVIVGEALLKDVRRSYINTGRRTVSIVGLSNIVVVDTDDVLLVASRAQSQDVKMIAQHLAKLRHPAADQHVVRQQAGGSSHVMLRADNFRVEHLTVLPGQQMEIRLEANVQKGAVTALSGPVTIATGQNIVRIESGSTGDFNGQHAFSILNEGEQAANLILSLSLASDISLTTPSAEQRKVG